MLDKLEFLLALDREKHFGRAADSCGVAQPTLSLGIQSLEEMLNVPLVRRSSRFLGFTPEGERVLVWARRMVGDAHAMRQEIFGMQRGVGSLIRLAAVPSAMSVVSTLTTPFQERHPGTRFMVLSRPSDALVHLLHQRDIDAGITYLDNDPLTDTITIPMYREQYLLLTTKDSPLASAQSVGWSEVVKLPLCLLTRDLQYRRIIDDTLKGLDLEPMPAIETDSEAALISHVLTGNWVSVVPRSMVDALHARDALHAIPVVNPEISHTLGLVVSDRFPIHATIEALMREARALCPPGVLAAE
jgi:DNA-binding transcriptional LysR family regulator